MRERDRERERERVGESKYMSVKPIKTNWNPLKIFDQLFMFLCFHGNWSGETKKDSSAHIWEVRRKT